jgi:hypothetical protein
MTLEQSQTAEATESQVRFSAEEVREILSIASELQASTLSAEQVRAIARDSGIADENLERALELYQQRRAAEEQHKRKATARKRWLTLTATVVAATIGVAGTLTYTATQVNRAITQAERQLLAASPNCSVYLDTHVSRRFPNSLPDERLIIQLSNGQVFALDKSFGRVEFASISPSGKHVVFADFQGVYVVTLGESSYRIKTLAHRFRRDPYGITPLIPEGVSFFAGWTTRNGKEVVLFNTEDGQTVEVNLPED